MSSKLTITTPEWCQLCGSGVFIVNCIFHNFSTCFYPWLSTGDYDDNDDDKLFCGMIDRRKAFSLICSRYHCQRSSPLQISDTLRAGFGPVQNLSSGLVEWSCAVAITTTPRRQKFETTKISSNMKRISYISYFTPRKS